MDVTITSDLNLGIGMLDYNVHISPISSFQPMPPFNTNLVLHFPPMTVLSQNIRVVIGAKFKRVFKDLVNSYNPDSVILMETRVSDDCIHDILSNLGFDKFVKVDYIGFSRGIWVLYNPSNITVGSILSSFHEIFLRVQADKSTIVDEAVKTIKTLEQTLENLQKKKVERLQSMCHPYGSNISREAFMADHPAPSSSANMNASVAAHNYPVEFQTWVSPNVVLNICGDEAQLSVCCPKKPCLLTSICLVLEKYKIDVLSAHISSDNNRCSYMIQSRARRDHSDLFPDIPVEEIFEHAASEIIQWLS